MTTRPEARLTPEESLRIERAAEWKSEYIDGEIFARIGASPRHVLIRWILPEWNDPEAELDFTSLQCRLKIAEVYAKVTFGDEERSDA